MDMVEGIGSIGKTPHETINSSSRSHGSVDSGYLTLTPHSGACTPVASGCRTRASISAKRHQRLRVDPLQSSKIQRHRSKLNSLLSASESGYFENSLETSGEAGHENQSTDGDLGVSLRSGARRNWRTTVPITPATTNLQLLSPPPSPAIPSSSFVASEPTEEDVEMKLVIVSQSTPRVTTSPRRSTPLPSIIISPTGRKASPAITSAENKKLSNLSIRDLSAVRDIKPKRLDFSHRNLPVALRQIRVIPDYTGRETVDLLALLGEKSNHWKIVSKILSFLSPQDLCAISMVSKVWRRICGNDVRANTRRLSHIILRQNVKENLKAIKKVKMETDLQSSPKSRFARKGFLREVQNLLQLPARQHLPPSSPPVSPSKVKFHSFVKASRTLAPWEHLLPCPRCSFPSRVDGEKNVATCSRQGCSMEFCTSCSSQPHAGPCNTPLLATPTKRNKRIVVGSRQSKRNLRRL